MGRYSLGLDYGTLSLRTVLVNIDTCEEVATAVCEYAHGVMSEKLPCGETLPRDYAIQHPQDYIDAFYSTVRECISTSGIDSADIVGVGVDFTASTVLPVDEKGIPLCFIDEFKDNKHAYVKLWKHHAAQKEADDINALAREMGEEWLSRYGGTVSSEWMLPKIFEILREDEKIFNTAFRFIEAGDFIVWLLTGRETHSVCGAGFKGLWNEESGYPSSEFLRRLDPRLENLVGDKIGDKIQKFSEVAGFVTDEVAEKSGLCAGTAVMPAFIDAHAALPALAIVNSGDLLMIIGTSTCHIMLGDRRVDVPGISGCVKDGIVDGLYAYEAGQACVGDSFDWFVKNCVPHSYFIEAEERGISLHKLLREKAERLEPGSGGLMALDWFNGNRTPYVDGGLSGVILGLNLNTKPEQIYRALIEATAYGTQRIIEIYEQSGIEIKRLYAAGGIAEKDEMLMQIYADVTGREIYLSGTAQACAYGSAVLGAVGERGYATLREAANALRKVKDAHYTPDAVAHERYAELYAQYKKIGEYFAVSERDMMTVLKEKK